MRGASAGSVQGDSQEHLRALKAHVTHLNHTLMLQVCTCAQTSSQMATTKAVRRSGMASIAWFWGFGGYAAGPECLRPFGQRTTAPLPVAPSSLASWVGCRPCRHGITLAVCLLRAPNACGTQRSSMHSTKSRVGLALPPEVGRSRCDHVACVQGGALRKVFVR
jgi:hypothetical protein